MTRADEQRIADMLEVATHISELVQRGHDAFTRDIAVRFAIERLLEILGEAASAVAPATREQLPDVAWRDIARLRIVLAHHYHRVDPEQVWSMATQDVPQLVAALRPSGGDC
ncbi:MAG TPA: HepT-like ribonuclease domain-containing protein [Egibacteraceae bacterium]|nr:HepT-like ribonuclease domain-containing protein [Egibacteraceae bacterium]